MIGYGLARPIQVGAAVGWTRRFIGGLSAIIAFAACIGFHRELTVQFESGAWNVSNFYSAVFGWASIQTGFLFAVYVYLATKTSPFMESVKETEAYRSMMAFTRATLWLVISVVLATVPLLVATPLPGDSISIVTVLIALWCGLVVYTFFRFLRIIRAFVAIESVRRQGK